MEKKTEIKKKLTRSPRRARSVRTQPASSCWGRTHPDATQAVYAPGIALLV